MTSFFKYTLSVFNLIAIVAGQDKVVVGYWSEWTAQEYPVSAVPWNLLTHVNYAFATIDSDTWSPRIQNPDALKELISKAKATNTKVLLSVGGGGDGSKYFSVMATQDSTRTLFARNLASIITQYGLDGVDIDWEFPGREGSPGNSHSLSDTDNYSIFLTRLKAFTNGALITAAVRVEPFDGPSGPLNNVAPFANLFDFINIMTYDINGPWSPETGPLAPLENEPGKGIQYSVKQSTSQWNNAGIPKDKIVLGVPFYYYPLEVQQDMSQSDSQYATVSNSNLGSYGFNQLINGNILSSPTQANTNNGWIRKFDKVSKTPWLFNKESKTYISYEDTLSLTFKTEYVRCNGYKGVMAWALNNDYNSVLLKSLQNVHNTDSCVEIPIPTDPPVTTTTATSTSTETSSFTTTSLTTTATTTSTGTTTTESSTTFTTTSPTTTEVFTSTTTSTTSTTTEASTSISSTTITTTETSTSTTTSPDMTSTTKSRETTTTSTGYNVKTSTSPSEYTTITTQDPNSVTTTKHDEKTNTISTIGDYPVKPSSTTSSGKYPAKTTISTINEYPIETTATSTSNVEYPAKFTTSTNGEYSVKTTAVTDSYSSKITVTAINTEYSVKTATATTQNGKYPIKTTIATPNDDTTTRINANISTKTTNNDYPVKTTISTTGQYPVETTTTTSSGEYRAKITTINTTDDYHIKTFTTTLSSEYLVKTTIVIAPNGEYPVKTITSNGEYYAKTATAITNSEYPVETNNISHSNGYPINTTTTTNSDSEYPVKATTITDILNGEYHVKTITDAEVYSIKTTTPNGEYSTKTTTAAINGEYSINTKITTTSSDYPVKTSTTTSNEGYPTETTADITSKSEYPLKATTITTDSDYPAKAVTGPIIEYSVNTPTLTGVYPTKTTNSSPNSDYPVKTAASAVSSDGYPLKPSVTEAYDYPVITTVVANFKYAEAVAELAYITKPIYQAKKCKSKHY
jgi:chitinase